MPQTENTTVVTGERDTTCESTVMERFKNGKLTMWGDGRVPNDEDDPKATLPYNTRQACVGELIALIFFRASGTKRLKNEPISDFTDQGTDCDDEESFPHPPDDASHHGDNLVTEEL